MNDDLINDVLTINALSITPARSSVLRFLATKRSAFTGLNDILKNTPGELNRTTLYRTLLSFCDADLLYKIVDNKNRVYYGIGEKLKAYIVVTELTNKNNYHFQCTDCERLFCLPVKMHAIELPAGFTKTETHLLLSGKCSICSARKPKHGV